MRVRSSRRNKNGKKHTLLSLWDSQGLGIIPLIFFLLKDRDFPFADSLPQCPQRPGLCGTLRARHSVLVFCVDGVTQTGEPQVCSCRKLEKDQSWNSVLCTMAYDVDPWAAKSSHLKGDPWAAKSSTRGYLRKKKPVLVVTWTERRKACARLGSPYGKGCTWHSLYLEEHVMEPGTIKVWEIRDNSRTGNTSHEPNSIWQYATIDFFFPLMLFVWSDCFPVLKINTLGELSVQGVWRLWVLRDTRNIQRRGWN